MIFHYKIFENKKVHFSKKNSQKYLLYKILCLSLQYQNKQRDLLKKISILLFCFKRSQNNNNKNK